MTITKNGAPYRRTRRLGIRCVSALVASLGVLTFAACGGLAEDGGVNILGGSPFLSACTAQSCDFGYQCLEGVCTRSCSADSQCSGLTVNVECLTGPTIGKNDGDGICAVPCASDDGCRQLGAGSYCDSAFCVAGSLEALPSSFESLELRRVPVAASPRLGACDPSEYTTSIEINLRTRRLRWSTCEANGDEVSGNSSSLELTDLQLALVQRAYQELSLSQDRKCTRGAEALTLDIEPAQGPELFFADDEHSSCPLPRLQRSSFVSGLNDLYAALELLTLGIR
jgi:hypothetical protein